MPARWQRNARGGASPVDLAGMAAVGYLRVSTQSQAGEKQTSLTDQRTAVEQLAARLGVRIGHIFQDPGFSGATIEQRPAMRSLIASCEASPRPADQPGYVLVLNDSRFGRFDDSEAATFWRFSLKQAGWLVRFAELDDVQNDEYRPVIRAFSQASATSYRKTLKANVKRGVVGTAEQGYWQSAIPFGYRLRVVHQTTRQRVLERGERRASKEKAILTPHAEEAALVSQIFERYASGTVSVKAVASWLTTAWPARKWSTTAVKAILRNPAYVGDVVWGRRAAERNERGTRDLRPEHERYGRRDAHDPIVSRELFARVAARLKTNQSARRGVRSDWILSGIVRCRCGKPFASGGAGRRRKSGKPATPVYRCATRGTHPAGKCPYPGTVQKDLLEDAALRELAAVIGSALHRRRLAAALDRAMARTRPQARTSEEIGRQIEAATDRQERIIAAIEAGTIREAEARTRMNALRREIMTLSAERDEVAVTSPKRTSGRSQREALLSLAMDFRAMATRLSGPALRELVRPWIQSATFDTDTRTLTLVVRSVPALIDRTDPGSAYGLPALSGILPASSVAPMILSPRYIPRLAATVGLFTRYGLADFAKQQGLEGLAREPEPGEDHSGSPDAARAFRKRLVELGPAYIKLGQVLSTRPDLLPDPYIRELEKLQDDVDPIPVEAVKETIETELGGRLSKLFTSFDDEPLGTASLGQVHAAELRDARPVVVKVQRPHIRNLLADDLAFFDELATFLSEHTAAGSRIDLIGIVQQLERALSDELDYRIEARNVATFRRSLAEFPRILVPRVIEAYTTERVLTTERVRGSKIDSISPLTRLEHDFHPVAEDLTRAYLKQITIDGHFHADPHPGNVFVVLADSTNPMTPSEVKANERRAVERPAVTPLSRLEHAAQREAAPQPPDVDVKLALIDFGMTARISTTLREQVVRLLLDLADNRGDDAADTLVEIGTELPGFDREAYVREIAALLARSYNLTIGELDAGKVLYELINISYQRGLRLPAELTLLAKALFNLDAVTKSIDPLYSPIPTIREFGNQIVAERARRDLNPRRLYELATRGSDLLMALPHRLDLITARMAANEFETRVEVPQITLMIEALQKVANRIFSGLVLAGLLVASAMLMPYRRPLATSGFVLAGAIGIWMVLAILWSDRTKRR